MSSMEQLPTSRFCQSYFTMQTANVITPDLKKKYKENITNAA